MDDQLEEDGYFQLSITDGDKIRFKRSVSLCMSQTLGKSCWHLQATLQHCLHVASHKIPSGLPGCASHFQNLRFK